MMMIVLPCRLKLETRGVPDESSKLPIFDFLFEIEKSVHSAIAVSCFSNSFPLFQIYLKSISLIVLRLPLIDFNSVHLIISRLPGLDTICMVHIVLVIL